MPSILIIWNDEIEEYLLQHGVSVDEFEEVVLNARKVERSRTSGRPIVFGQTSTGRFLACVFEYLDDHKFEIIPVTAFESDGSH